jgi:uncharacterized protein (TIGR03067 family)
MLATDPKVMKTRTRWVVLSIVFLAVSGALAADGDVAKKDIAALQGEWTLVSGTADGQPMADAMVKQMKRVCKEDEVTVTLGTQLILKAKITVDPEKKPKTIDYEMTGGVNAGKKQLGIYQLEGDSLRACFGAPGADRPTDFSSKEGDRQTLTVWKKKVSASEKRE